MEKISHYKIRKLFGKEEESIIIMEMKKIGIINLFGMKEENIQVVDLVKIFVYQIKNKNGKLEGDVKIENTVKNIEGIENIDTINIVMVIDTLLGIGDLNQLLHFGIVSEFFEKTKQEI